MTDMRSENTAAIVVIDDANQMAGAEGAGHGAAGDLDALLDRLETSTEFMEEVDAIIRDTLAQTIRGTHFFVEYSKSMIRVHEAALKVAEPAHDPLDFVGTDDEYWQWLRSYFFDRWERGEWKLGHR
jgi:hypothetical protein